MSRTPAEGAREAAGASASVQTSSAPQVSAEPVSEHTVGVGPWEGEWPTDERYDPELLRDGDRRNVVDEYRYWTMDAIIADLDARRHDFHVAVENWQHDLNIGSVVRTANAFNAKAVHIVGKRRWNRRGAMVTDRYQHIYHHETPQALAEWCAEHEVPLLGVDNFPDSVALEEFELPQRCMFLFGQEGPGLTDAAHKACQAVLSIQQYGSTRSMNAAAAAAITMHAWIRRWEFGQTVK